MRVKIFSLVMASLLFLQIGQNALAFSDIPNDEIIDIQESNIEKVLDIAPSEHEEETIFDNSDINQYDCRTENDAKSENSSLDGEIQDVENELQNQMGFPLLNSTTISGPTVEVYLTNHPDIVYGGYTYAALNTTMCDSYRSTAVTSMGYSYSSYSNVPIGPSTIGSVIRTLDDDALFTIFGHANKGRIIAFDSSYNYTRLSANAVSDSNNYSLEYYFGSTNNKLKQMRFAHFSGCRTYGNDSTYGDLTSRCTSLGVDVVLTHVERMYPTPGTYFDYLIYYYGNYNSSGTSIYSCITSAKNYTRTSYNNSSNAVETTNINIGGADTASAFKPASYGS